MPQAVSALRAGLLVAILIGPISTVAAATAFPPPHQQPRGNAVIAGTVVDEDHVPVARTRVQVFSAEDARKAADGSQRLGRSVASIDGTGTFQTSGLPPGDYVVAAEPIPGFPSGGPLPSHVYGVTFYPSTLDLSEARPITAVEGQVATVQIALVPVRPVRVTGTVTSRSGRSTKGLDVRLFRQFGGFGGGAGVAVVGADGRFEIPAVPPGTYALSVEPHGSRPGERGREFVERTLEVMNHDVDLSLTLTAGASLSGRIVVEPSGAVATPIGLRVMAAHANGDDPYPPGQEIAVAVSSDWSFRMTGLFGPYDFLVRSDRSESIVVATRVLVDGTAYQPPKGIAFREGDHEILVTIGTVEPPKPPDVSTQTSAALVQQFKNETVFWKQIEIAKAIVDKGDPTVLAPLADWLHHEDRHTRANVAFIFAAFGDARGLQTIADILTDRTERREGQGIPGVASDGRYRFEQQVRADRYYAAHVLGDMRDPRGVDLLVPLLNDPETQDIVPWSLGQIGDTRAIPPLIAALDNDDPSMRVLTIYALEALHAKEAVPRLLTLVNDNRKSRFGAGVPVSEAAKAAIARLQ